MNRPAVYLAVFAVVAVGTAAPAGSVAAFGGPVPNAGTVDAAVSGEMFTSGANDSQVDVGTGSQLATVIQLTDDDTRSDMAGVAFELSYESDRAAAAANRSEELRDSAAGIRADYADATEAYREGDLTRSAFAQRLATLSGRAGNLLDSYSDLRPRMANVSDAELDAAGVNRSGLRADMADLDRLRGAGTTALLARFTAQTDGEVRLRLDDGLLIEVERDGGELTREIDRPQDGDASFTVAQTTALGAARDALSTPERGIWTIESSDLDTSDGLYTFEFALSTRNLTGVAEVSVDGSSGTVVSLDEEIERVDEDDETLRSSDELVLRLVDGTLAPEQTVTIQVRSGGHPVRDAVVRVNDAVVGTTGTNGTLAITLPAGGDVEVSATKGDRDGRLRFEFEEASDPDEEVDGATQDLEFSASLDGDTVTVEVTEGGSSVEGASVFAEGEPVGTTGPDGRVTFALPADSDDFDVTVVHDGTEIETRYVVENGTLVPEE